MKRKSFSSSLVSTLLSGFILLASVQPTPAPTIVEGGMAFCIVALTCSVGVAYLYHQCERKQWLVRTVTDTDGEQVVYSCSDAIPNALGGGGQERCAGPFAAMASCLSVMAYANTYWNGTNHCIGGAGGPIRNTQLQAFTGGHDVTNMWTTINSPTNTGDNIGWLIKSPGAQLVTDTNGNPIPTRGEVLTPFLCQLATNSTPVIFSGPIGLFRVALQD